MFRDTHALCASMTQIRVGHFTTAGAESLEPCRRSRAGKAGRLETTDGRANASLLRRRYNAAGLQDSRAMAIGILIGLLIVTRPVAGALVWTLLFASFFTVIGLLRLVAAIS